MLITPRLRLRELEALDFAALRAIDDDPEVHRYRGGRVIARPRIVGGAAWSGLPYVMLR